MQLTGGIKMTKSHWLVLDLLAILLVASTLIGIIAIWTGTWWPFESLLLPEWPLLAFFAWFLATSTALVLIGAHLQWSNTVHAASAPHEPAIAAPQPLTTLDLAHSRTGASALGLDQNEPAEDEQPDSEGVESELVLTAAGR